MKLIITGAAGFIGYFLTEKFLSQGHQVIGIDSINDYYDTSLKKARLKNLGIDEVQENISATSSIFSNFQFVKCNIENGEEIDRIVQQFEPNIFIHLAAQAGVRYSISNPEAYIQSNILGFFNVINACKKYNVGKFIYASSSSVYGDRAEVPFVEEMNVDQPVSLYAATKKSNELIAHTYSHLFNIQTIGLRFFTVYGPFGRPDMAYFSFVKSILNGESINVFNEGNLSRDFTYIDDIVNGIELISQQMFADNSSLAKYEIFNIGNSSPVKLMTFINTLENAVGKKANITLLPMQAGDVHDTYASVDKLINKVNYKPQTSLEEGLTKFVNWYKNYYNV
jgi:UDP-glucuronate 4-epimerase